MATLSQSQNDALRLACFLFNLEEEHGRDYLFGGERLGEAIDGFCRMTGVERPVWEEIVWPRMGAGRRPAKPLTD